MSDTHLNPRGEDPVAPLPDPLTNVLRDPVEEEGVARMWRRIEERRPGARSHFGTFAVWSLAGASLALVGLLAVGVFGGWLSHGQERQPAIRPPSALTLKDGRAVPPVELSADAAEAVSRIELSDDSHIVVSRGAAIEPLVSSGREFVVRLRRGQAHFDVTPGGPRRWVIEAGVASVEVVGTEFSVLRSAASVRVEVERGVVLVRGAAVPDGVARLVAGMSLDVASLAAATPSAAPVGEGAAPAPPSPHPAWREQASRGEYRDAYGGLGSDGLLRETEHARSADDLFTLADVARLSGHPAEAVAPLEGLLVTYPTSARGPLAALTLGRIQLELGNPARASRALERALALGAPSGLEEDVYVRLVEAHMLAGNRTQARSVGDDYARRFPGGRRRADVEKWLGR